MITKYDLKRYAEINKDNSKCWFIIDENDNVINKETKEIVYDLDHLLSSFRKKLHCDFESIYYEHVLDYAVIRCKECGTVIFTFEDYRYEPHLNCPTCSDYKTNFEYWTKEEIDNDIDKQKQLQGLQLMEKERIEADKRHMKRHKYDWEIGKCHLNISKNKRIYFELQCKNLFKSFLKGLRLKVSMGNKDESGVGYIIKKTCTIPLSISYIITLHKAHKYK